MSARIAAAATIRTTGMAAHQKRKVVAVAATSDEGYHRGRRSLASANAANPAPDQFSPCSQRDAGRQRGPCQLDPASSAAQCDIGGHAARRNLVPRRRDQQLRQLPQRRRSQPARVQPTSPATTPARTATRPWPGCRRASITRASRQPAPAATTAWWHRANRRNTCRRPRTAERAMARSHGMWRRSATSGSAATCRSCHNGVIAISKQVQHVITTLDCGSCHSTLNWTVAAPQAPATATLDTEPARSERRFGEVIDGCEVGESARAGLAAAFALALLIGFLSLPNSAVAARSTLHADRSAGAFHRHR